MSQEQYDELGEATRAFESVRKQGYEAGDPIYNRAFDRMMWARQAINTQQLAGQTESAESAWQKELAKTAAGSQENFSNPKGDGIISEDIIKVKITYTDGTIQISSINKSQLEALQNSNEVVTVETVPNETEDITRTTPEGETITATPQNPFVIDPNTGTKIFYNPEIITQDEVKEIIKNSTTEELQNIDLETQTEADFIEGILDEMERQKSEFNLIPQAFADTGESEEDSKINFDFDYRIIAVVVFIVVVLASAAFLGGGASLG